MRVGPEFQAHLLRTGRAHPRIGVAGAFFGESLAHTCIFPVVAAAPAMSPADALTGKGHVRYSPAFSTGLADPQEVDQRSPTSSCAQNSQICTALVFIGIEPAPG